MVTTIRLPDELHRKLKEQAEKKGLTLNAYLVSLLTQEEAAKRMHVSKKTIINWEKGKIVPSFVVLQALSGLYGIPINNIFLPTEST